MACGAVIATEHTMEDGDTRGDREMDTPLPLIRFRVIWTLPRVSLHLVEPIKFSNPGKNRHHSRKEQISFLVITRNLYCTRGHDTESSVHGFAQCNDTITAR